MFAVILLIFKTSFVNVICLDQRLTPFQNTIGHPLVEIIGDYSTGVRVLDVYLSFDPPMGLYDCALECSYRTRCKSFNYSSKMKYCELSHVTKVDGNVDSTTATSNAFIHSDIQSWNMHASQRCVNIFCPENMKCDSNSGNCSYSDCGPSENIPNMITNSIENNAVGLSTVYQCAEGFQMTDEDGHVVVDGELVAVCNATAEWERENSTCVAKALSIRLVEKQSDRVGRVEVYHNNKWGQLVDKDWTDKDATVVCRSLGYSEGMALPSSSSEYGLIWSNDFSCDGNEFKLEECQKGNWGLSYEVLSTGAVAWCDPLRLTGSSSEQIGKVEVYKDGQWWSLCGDIWNHNNSDVICRSLGHRYAVHSYYVKQDGWMMSDEISCNGREDVLNKCKHKPVAAGRCSLPKVVGVICDPVKNMSCDDGWIHNNGSCYFFSSSKRSWSKSREHCNTHGGDLAKVSNDDENFFIIGQIQEMQNKSENSRPFWIGGNDQLGSGEWKWVVDMSDILYTQWAEGQPDSKNQRCLVIWEDKLWHDDRCWSAHTFVCMKQANPCTDFHDCQDLHSCYNISDVHTFYPDSGKVGYTTSCDIDNDNEQWMLIMKWDSDSDFDKDWNEYKEGFGDAFSNTFWIGNEALFQITTLKKYMVRLILNLSASGIRRFQYEDFSVKSELDRYQIDFALPVLECKLTHKGREYRGRKNTTASGIQCQAWKSQTPHPHQHTDEQENYCRNPDGIEAPWCYTVKPTNRYELCGIPFCDDAFFLRSKGYAFSTKENGKNARCARRNHYGWWYSPHCGSEVYNSTFMTITMQIKQA